MADQPEHDGAPVELTEDETSIMLGCFAGAPPEALSASTGLSLARVAAIIARLARLGLIDEGAMPLIPLDGKPRKDSGALAVVEVEGPPTARDSLVELIDSAVVGLVPKGDPVAVLLDPSGVRADEADEAGAGEVDAGEADAGGEEPEGRVDADVDADATRHRRTYELELRALPAGTRVARAAKASVADLFAYCFDPDPAVIAAVLGNPAATPEHARLVAFHHRTSRGLEEVAARPSFAHDAIVHRQLLRNPALGESMLRRLMGTKRLLEVHKLGLDRDVPERTRVAARALFRARFATASPEERVDVVWATEGRVLTAMTGMTFDGRTSSILCSRSYTSIMLIQSLARFPATPPALIAHLLRQPLVKRQAHLKNQLLSHPNTPSEAKRRP